MHPCTLGDHRVSMSFTHRPSHRVRGTLVATGAFCDVDDSREAYITLSVISLLTTETPGWRAPSHSVRATSLIVFKSASVVTIYLEFELTEWQGHKIRCSALVIINTIGLKMRDEVTGDCAARRGGAMVQRQITANRPPLWSKPSAPRVETQACQDPPDSQKSSQSEGMGKESECEQASREREKKKEGIKWIKKC